MSIGLFSLFETSFRFSVVFLFVAAFFIKNNNKSNPGSPRCVGRAPRGEAASGVGTDIPERDAVAGRLRLKDVHFS